MKAKVSSMKLKLITALLSVSFIVYGQKKKENTTNPITSKYAGYYSYSEDNGGSGEVDVYPETDTTILFYMSLYSGMPRYNLGQLYGRVKIVNDTGTYFDSRYDIGCKFGFKFSPVDLITKIVNKQDICGLGHAVSPEGSFKRETNKSEGFFETLESDTVFFKETSPEDYYKR